MLPSDMYSSPMPLIPCWMRGQCLTSCVAMACAALRSPALMRRVERPVPMGLTTTSC